MLSGVFFPGSDRTAGRVVEGARLESVYAFKAYRGVEPPSVGQIVSKYVRISRNMTADFT